MFNETTWISYGKIDFAWVSINIIMLDNRLKIEQYLNTQRIS